MKKHDKSGHILQIYDRLRQSPVTLEVLYAWITKQGIDISKRTLYRYLDDLEKNIKFDGEKLLVYENEFNKKTWKLEFEHSSSKFTSYDINSFYIMRNMGPMALRQGRDSSFKKWDEFLYTQTSKSTFENTVDVNNLSFAHSNFTHSLYSKEEHDYLEEIIHSIQNHQKVKLLNPDYFVSFIPCHYNIDHYLLPMQVLYHAGAIWIAFCYPECDIFFTLPFSIDMKLKFSQYIYNPQHYFSKLKEFFKNNLGLTPNINDDVYEIEFQLDVFYSQVLKNRFFHHTQKVTIDDEGYATIQFQSGINIDLIFFLLHYLPGVRIIRPQILIEIVDMHLLKYQENKKGFK
ncbi:WYL domain-containing protein [Polluticaenibacter yanchengensis]|uniref:WYL domain-containing protein n=1 Tax=Polluticaenibacter yanchengensis TaxID=3014562 RepID=A0ABT4UNF8_9BACT|nr:hypothetical protein [Chitinophagaceae bacterium LY-5]